MSHVGTSSRWGERTTCTGGRFGVHLGAALVDGTPVVAVEGELDLATSGLLRASLSLAASIGASGRVILDVACLRFVDAAGLRPIVAVDRQLRAAGGAGVSVRGATGLVRRVFELTALGDLLDESSSEPRADSVSDDERRALDDDRRDAGLSVAELFVEYFALGGTATRDALAVHLRGDTATLDRREHDVVAQAVQEYSLDAARSHRSMVPVAV